MRFGSSVLLLALLGACHSNPPAPPSAPDAGTTDAGVADAGAPLDESCTLVTNGLGPTGTVSVRTETVVTGLEVPWAIAFLPNGDWLVTERPGRIRLIRNGQLVPTPVVTIAVASTSEGGLLGLALHPDFAKNRLFYVYVSVTSTGAPVNRVLRWKLSDDGLSATQDRVIFDLIPAAAVHDGGRLHFGPDGMLYVGTGDARQPSLAQDPASPSGKLLRLTPDGEVPADNPTKGSPVFLLGLRNTQGFAWRDPNTLYVVDHGPSGELNRRAHDEVNVAKAGENLGWPTIYSCEAQPGLVTPSLTWETAVPPGGAAIYTGSDIPEWKGSLLMGVLGSRHLHRVVFDDTDTRRVKQHEVYFQGDPPNGFGRLREVTMGPDGFLYVTTSNCDGRGTCPVDKDRILRVRR
jgi:glucose/arabinose dehydrogenase